MSDSCCRLCHVSGRVQGVFFRASTARRAEQLGVTGHAINLRDGRVEVLACGPRPAVDALCRWLRGGPAGARVDDLEIGEADCGDQLPESFSTG